MYSNHIYQKVCIQCGCYFTAQKSTTRYCSERCANIAKKHEHRDERLAQTTYEVRERERYALLDQNYYSISDAARLLQISRTTFYKIAAEHGLKLNIYTARTIRISRQDLEELAQSRRIEITPDLNPFGNLMTREQVMQKYEVSESWFHSVLKKNGVKAMLVGNLGFYEQDKMEELFAENTHIAVSEWYTFDEVRRMTGMRTESISDYLTTYKIPKKKKNNITYISKFHWDEARGNNIDKDQYYTMAQISQKTSLSRNHLYTVLKEKKISRIKRGNFVYFRKDQIDAIFGDKINKEDKR